MGIIYDLQGQSVAFFAANKTLLHLKLSGPPVGPAVGPSMMKTGPWRINVLWSESEQVRWQAYNKSGTSQPATQLEKLAVHTGKRTAQTGKKTVQEEPKQQTGIHPRLSRAYTPHEKRWLKVHYRSEFHFLRAHGLHIYKNEDREEGRAMARQFMARRDPKTRRKHGRGRGEQMR
jgi:hypothetical protein